MPVLQGFKPEEYRDHIRQYGNRLTYGMWVGVGSVCKRNGNPRQIEEVLLAIKTLRPDLKLHGFGLKRTALKSGCVTELLYSCDSMAWSSAGRRIGRGNDVNLAKKYVDGLTALRSQGSLLPRLFRAV